MKKVEYLLFRQPISRRTYSWLLFLCALAALWIYLSSRRVVDKGSHPQAGTSSAPAI